MFDMKEQQNKISASPSTVPSFGDVKGLLRDASCEQVAAIFFRVQVFWLVRYWNLKLCSSERVAMDIDDTQEMFNNHESIP